MPPPAPHEAEAQIQYRGMEPLINDLWDQTPLKHEPFLTEFLVRKLQNMRGDGWIGALAQTVLNEDGSREEAKQWSSQYAFAPESDSPLQIEDLDHSSPVLSRVFVQFYWQLCNGNRNAALEIVNRERRRLGFLTLLEDWGQRATTSRDLLREHTSQTSISLGSRGKRAPRKLATDANEKLPGTSTSATDASGDAPDADVGDTSATEDKGVVVPRKTLTRAVHRSTLRGKKRIIKRSAASGTGRGKLIRKDHPKEPTRQLLPRAATDRKNISKISKDESKSLSNAKRGLAEEDLEDHAEACNGVPQSASVASTRQTKKSRVHNASGDAIQPLQGKADQMSGPADTSGVAAPPVTRTPRTIPRSKYAPRITKGKKDHSIQGADPSSHPNKRRKEEYSETRIAGVLEETTSNEDRRKTPLAVPLDARTGPAIDHHRGHTDRVISKLPRHLVDRLVTHERAPIPAPHSLGVPANLAEEDRMIRNCATEAIVLLSNTVTVSHGWAFDEGVQDFPPHDDHSDEEEDIPLRKQILSRAISRQSNATSVTYDPPLLAPPGPSRPIVPKKPLDVYPPIWAKSRQEICESLDCFRSYQSGVYHADGFVKGYLLSGFSASRDIFARDGRLIISHGGGKAESLHSRKGQTMMVKASDQKEGDISVRALLRTYEQRRPIVLLIDDRYVHFPYDLSSKQGCTYAVLGFYHIAHVWAERQTADNERGFVVRYKFAFEWCNKQPDPWWVAKDSAPPCDETSISAQPDIRNFTPQDFTCYSCGNKSPQVYEQGGMCLHPGCISFWTINGSTPPHDLTYAEAFLKAPFECNHGTLESIIPSLPDKDDIIITSRRFSRGWHCESCGRLSCRYKWEKWECQNCGNSLQILTLERNPNEFWANNPSDPLNHKIAPNSGIIVSRLQPFHIDEQRQHVAFYHKYQLPEHRGNIYLILGSIMNNKVADEIFREYQVQSAQGHLELRRWPLRSHQCRGELLTNYFSQNTGEPYQYVGGTNNTVPFEMASSAVVKARDLIHSRMRSVLQAEKEPDLFNEVLSAAYMESQSMAFHSDAEKGLGPRVASLSLGSSAIMHFRPLKKYRQDTAKGTRNTVLTLTLRHGDVLIMDGAGIQQYYEHTVVPHNFRIAATARRIDNRNH